MEELWETERETAQQQYDLLLQQARTVSERNMRRELMGELLLSQTAEVCTELLRMICLQSPRDPLAAQLLLSFQDQSRASHRLSYAEIRAIYQCARERGYHNVQRLFLSFRPAENSPFEHPDEIQLRGHPALKDLSLGERKFLARKLDIHILEKLLYDPDATVIRNLLRNPRLTEKEVLLITTKRPNHPDILEEVARSHRWFQRYRVKSALVQNPYTPFPIALQAMPFLRTDDLHTIANSPNLHPQVVATAQEFLRLRELPLQDP